VEAEIRRHVDKLATRYPDLIACRVSVEALHNQHRTGNIHEVHVTLSLPGRDLAVTRAPHHAKERLAHPDVHSAVRDAFRAAEHQLQSSKTGPRQGIASSGSSAVSGQVAQMQPDADHGFILNNVGSQLYFHRDSVTKGDFAAMKVGDRVHYVEEEGNAGPVASKVWPA
jgi:cold shock CspA family protein